MYKLLKKSAKSVICVLVILSLVITIMPIANASDLVLDEAQNT